jgi:hypothetical protein
MSRFESANRAVKVEGICRALDRFSAHRGAPVRASDVIRWDDWSWEIFAWASGVTTPSVTTRTAVLDRLVARDEAVLASNAAVSR